MWACGTDRDASCSLLSFDGMGADRLQAGQDRFVVFAEGGQQGDLSG
jgi:hypothetical protein